MVNFASVFMSVFVCVCLFVCVYVCACLCENHGLLSRTNELISCLAQRHVERGGGGIEGGGLIEAGGLI